MLKTSLFATTEKASSSQDPNQWPKRGTHKFLISSTLLLTVQASKAKPSTCTAHERLHLKLSVNIQIF